MKYRVVSAFCLGGGNDVYPGAIIELDESTARHKIAIGFVVPVEEEKPEVRMPEGEPRVKHRSTRGEHEPS